MNPNQPYTAPPTGQNPYDFITNPAPAPKRSLLGGGGFGKKIIMVVGGAVILMIVLTIVASLFGSSGGSSESLKSLVLQQQEIVRIAEAGSNNAADGSTRGYAQTTKLAVTSQQQALTAYLETRGIQVDQKELLASKDTETDQLLESARANNRYDDVFRQIIDEKMQTYATAMQEAYNNSGSEEAKAVLSQNYTSTATILGLEQ